MAIAGPSPHHTTTTPAQTDHDTRRWDVPSGLSNNSGLIYSHIRDCRAWLHRPASRLGFGHLGEVLGLPTERFALPACGRAWILLGSRKNSKREKCLKMPQNPTRQVHALLATFLLKKTQMICNSHTATA